jgi:hypothetical protein
VAAVDSPAVVVAVAVAAAAAAAAAAAVVVAVAASPGAAAAVAVGLSRLPRAIFRSTRFALTPQLSTLPIHSRPPM